MRRVEEIDRSLVAIFDIEGFSRKNNPEQARMVSSFVDSLEQQLQSLQDLGPDAFSTGDGAIVSLGKNCRIDKSTTERFLSFVISFMTGLLQNGPVVRTAVHYSEKDSVISLADSAVFRGGFIQIGDTINHATRVLGYCEPRELMISEAVHQLIRRVGLDTTRFEKNELFVTKHNVTLETYSFNPPAAQRELFYCPDSPWHPYKKYSYFPPVKNSSLKYFNDNGLGRELGFVISNAYDSWRFLSDTMSFLSSNSVVQVLSQLQYDPLDQVFVLSRNDIRGFWEQVRTDTYIKRLKARLGDGNRYINQTRVMVYDRESDNNDLMPNRPMFDELKSLHNTNSFISYPSDMLRAKYHDLEALRFGFTLSVAHQYAVIPIPAPDVIEAKELRPERIGELLSKYNDYDRSYGPMKAIITADKKFVSWLINEMKSLIAEPDRELIK